MNNNLLLQAQKWLAGLGINSEATQTILKVNREDVDATGFFEGNENERDAAFLNELKTAVSKKLYFEKGDQFNYHINSF